MGSRRRLLVEGVMAARWRGQSGSEGGGGGGADDHGGDLPRILYVHDLAELLGRSEKAVRHAMHRGLLPEPMKLAGRLAWRRADVLSWVAETHGVSRSEPSVNITIHPYDHDPSRFRVTYEIPKQTPGDPRRRLRKVAPAGLDHAGALAWARRQSREIWAELMGIHQEERPPEPYFTPLRQPRAPKPVRVSAARERSPEPKRKPGRDEPKIPTLAVFWDRFETSYLARQKPATRRHYLSVWSLYIRPTLGSIPIDSITRPDLSRLRAAIEKLKPSGRNQVISKLRTILRIAADWDVIIDEDIPRLRMDREERKKEPEVYTEAELGRLCAAAGPEDRALVLLLVHGCLRVSEVAALRWSDLDLQAGLMTIRHNFSAGIAATPKGGVAKPVGLTPELVEALREVPRRIEQVLARRRGDAWQHHTAHSIAYALHQLQDAAGLRRTGPHLMRHTGLTMLARRGCDPWRLQAHARHARIATTQRYVHLAGETAAIEAAAFWRATPETAGSRAQTRPKLVPPHE
ncbi:MAG: tyrosine-type recombinase/integrase [Nannocystis sp.]|nr:tyrosine-type recombinase/integrase [Nannocystis sp.]